MTLLILGGHGARAEVVTIVSPGQVPAVVSASDKVSRDMAGNLCEYLNRITGRNIAPGKPAADTRVVIHVGADEFVLKHAPEVRGLKADGFLIKYVAAEGRQHLLLAGMRWSASQWAVERFLHDFAGVRWLFPDAKYGEVVPKRASLSIDSTLNKIYEPDYAGRSNGGMYNYIPSPPGLYLRGGPAGGGPTDWLFGTHGLQYMFTGKDFAEHPEWFPFFDGKRQWWSYGNGWQICLTHPGTVQHAVKYIRDYFEKHPEDPMVAIGQNDGAGWCQCPLCTEWRQKQKVTPRYSQSEEWWLWVNKVAAEVRKIYPGKMVESLAYSETSSPPRFDLEDNIAITKTIVIPREIGQAEEWKKKAKSVSLYSYPWGAFFFGFRHYPHAMRDFLKWGHDDLGALGHTAELGGDWTFDGPKYAYMQALQWDVNANPDQIMNEFCEAWYGPAKAPMMRFWDRLEQVYERRPKEMRLIFYTWPQWIDNDGTATDEEFKPYRLSDIDMLDQQIAAAEKLAAKSPADSFRVARIADAWRFFRAILVSKLKFGDRENETLRAASTEKRALALAREIATLRAEREHYRSKLRAFPNINPRMVKSWYWGGMTAATVFSEERTLIDRLCGLYTSKVKPASARTFWQAVRNTDPLYEAAQTQVYLLDNTERPNLLKNGGFENGTLDGWKSYAEGPVGANMPADVLAVARGETGQAPRSDAPVGLVAESGRDGRYAAYASGPGLTSLSQRVSVSPGERYHLSAWGRYVTAVPQMGVPLEMTVTFQQTGKGMNSEPTRCLAKTTEVGAGWIRLNSAFTVPPQADTAEISLRRNYPLDSGSVLWDDVKLEKVMNGPKIVPGLLSGAFDKGRLSDSWADSPVGNSGVMPVIEKGQLIFGSEPAATLISLPRFDDVLQHDAADRYRMRIRLSPGANASKPSSLDWGIQSGQMPISTADSGLYWAWSQDSSKPEPVSKLLGYAYQDGKQTGGCNYSSAAFGKIADAELCYTLYFGREKIEVYVKSGSTDASDGALLGEYVHGISEITKQGPVYLKLTGCNIRLKELSVARVGSSAQAARVVPNP